MKNLTPTNQDWHVGSTFSNGSGSVAEIVEAAEACELKSVCVVDKARRSSPWARALADACHAAGRDSELEVRSGIEIEILDTNGASDPPPFTSKTDRLFVAAYRLPTPRGPLELEEARSQIERGELFPGQVAEWLVRAYAGAATRRDSVVIAQPFSVFPLLGLDPARIHISYVRWLAGVLQTTDAAVEVNERLRAPSSSVVDCLMTAHVPVLPASGARSVDEVGSRDWYDELLGSVSSLARAA